MIHLAIPDGPQLDLHSLVLDFNGTLAFDGALLEGVRPRLEVLAGQLRIHVVTGDTFGSARAQLAGLPCELTVLARGAQAIAKREHVKALGPAGCVCVGNGRNDRLMLEAAALAIAVVQREGAAPETMFAADVVVGHICDALDLLANPNRLVATLRR